MKAVEARRAWVHAIYSPPLTVVVVNYHDQTVLGVARCKSGDTWDDQTGRTIALARALKQIK